MTKVEAINKAIKRIAPDKQGGKTTAEAISILAEVYAQAPVARKTVIAEAIEQLGVVLPPVGGGGGDIPAELMETTALGFQYQEGGNHHFNLSAFRNISMLVFGMDLPTSAGMLHLHFKKNGLVFGDNNQQVLFSCPGQFSSGGEIGPDPATRAKMYVHIDATEFQGTRNKTIWFPPVAYPDHQHKAYGQVLIVEGDTLDISSLLPFMGDTLEGWQDMALMFAGVLAHDHTGSIVFPGTAGDGTALTEHEAELQQAFTGTGWTVIFNA